MGMTNNGLSSWQAESEGIELLNLTIGDLLYQIRLYSYHENLH